GGAERPRDDEEVARARARAAWVPVGATEGGHRDEHVVCARGVAAANRHAGLVQSLVERDDVLEVGVAGQPQADEERDRLRARRGEVADVRGGGAKAEVAPRDEVEAEMHALDERVLRDDEALDLRRVVLDPVREPALLERREQPELAGLVEPHSSSMRVRSSSVAGSSA